MTSSGYRAERRKNIPGRGSLTTKARADQDRYFQGDEDIHVLSAEFQCGVCGEVGSSSGIAGEGGRGQGSVLGA